MKKDYDYVVNHTIKKIKYDWNDIQNIKSMTDFYNQTGALLYFKQKIDIENGEMMNVADIYINHKQHDMLKDILFVNLKKQSKYKSYSNDYIKTGIAWHMLDYSPATINSMFYDETDTRDVPENEIWILHQED